MRFQIIVFLAVVGVFCVGCTESTAAPESQPVNGGPVPAILMKPVQAVQKKLVRAVKKKVLLPSSENIALCPSADLVSIHASLLGNGKYQELEITLSELRQNKKPSLKGDSLFYTCLIDLASRIVYKPLFDAWCSSGSKSYLPYLYRGMFNIQWAWDARGGGYASSVKKNGWQLFRERLVQAKADLELARKRNRKVPEIYLCLQIVARGMGDRKAADIYFAEGESLAPCHYPFLWERLQFLCAKWGGSSSEMWRFARKQATRRSQFPLAPLIILEAHHEEGSRRRNSADYFSLPKVKKEIETIHAEIEKAMMPNVVRLYALRRKIYGKMKDRVKYRQWWFISARAGDRPLQFFVGNNYSHQGGDEYQKASFNWLLAAAKNGHAEAMRKVVFDFSGGRIMKADNALAVSYAAKAVFAGNKRSCGLLSMLTFGTGQPFDKTEVVAAFEMGARLGFTKAKVGLARSILQGWKRPRSLETALSCLVAAAKEGDQRAKRMQARLEHDLWASHWVKRPSIEVLRKVKSPIEFFRRCVAKKDWKLARQVANYQITNLKAGSTRRYGDARKFWSNRLAEAH